MKKALTDPHFASLTLRKKKTESKKNFFEKALTESHFGSLTLRKNKTRKQNKNISQRKEK